MKSESLFASSLQTTDHWLDELSEDMNWTDARRSYHILGSVLHASAPGTARIENHINITP